MPSQQQRPAQTGADQATVNSNFTHEAPTPDMGVNAPESDLNMDTRADVMNVRVLHGNDNKLEVQGNNTPSESDLYEVVNREAECQPDLTSVTEVSGTTARPVAMFDEAKENNLFIDGSPSIDDIHQGGFADCYFLASVGSVVSTDPSHITDMVEQNGANADINLHRYDASASPPTWTGVTMNVTHELLQRADASGNAQGSLVGAGVRVAEQPSVQRYYVEMYGSSLHIFSERVYEMAMWAPLLEKGYAAYVQQYGQYGGFATASAKPMTNADGSTRGGYDNINGGIAHYSYPIMYGNDCDSFAQTNMSFTAGGDNITTNLPALQNLIRLALQDNEHATEDDSGVDDGERFNMTVGIGRDTAVNRLDSQAQHVLGQADIDDHAALKTQLNTLRTNITAWSAATGTARTTALNTLAGTAATICAPETHAVLFDSASPAAYRDLLQMGLIVKNIATDGSRGQRSTYAWHSYTVEDAFFHNAADELILLTQQNVATKASEVDGDNSTVYLRNPHGKNEPNPTGADEGDGPSAHSGHFSMTLNQFFNAFSFQQHGVVET